MADGSKGRLYGVKAIADHLGVSARTVERWISRGLDVPIMMVGGRYVAYPEDLAQWCRRRSRVA